MHDYPLAWGTITNNSIPYLSLYFLARGTTGKCGCIKKTLYYNIGLGISGQRFNVNI